MAKSNWVGVEAAEAVGRIEIAAAGVGAATLTRMDDSSVVAQFFDRGHGRDVSYRIHTTDELQACQLVDLLVRLLAPAG